MPNILVVDDSAVDRRIVGGLLGKQPDWEISFAENGVQALEAMAAHLPDIIVTDLQMPEMDGLQLVTEVKEKHSSVPVILITGKGSEEIAIAALRAGASSYSPKSLLNRDLVDTVRHVLSVAGARKGHQRLLARLAHTDVEFVLENDNTLVAPLIGFLQEIMVNWDQSERIRIGIALDEALVNALFHGNLEVSSDLREDDDTAYYDLIKQRAKELPYSDRRVHVNAKITADEIFIRIRDEGPGFDPTKLADPTDPENLEKLSGRGLLLIRTFMNEVTHNDKGNEITMIRRHGEDDEPDDDEDE